mmetsp:Transcript_30196/g.59280  ORF Transcript_30196/g.59280 Transcript_30196/m.59280 type:complete len:84 (+) Transcript_30196:66-317(+)
MVVTALQGFLHTAHASLGSNLIPLPAVRSLSTGQTYTLFSSSPLFPCRALVNEKTEVYSFGMVILELLTAKPPAVQKSNGGIE